jgi:8-oxo-dGTP pyrophosphatase MutT (NUDIX family)
LTCWFLAKGKLNYHEEAWEGARREAREETGWTQPAEPIPPYKKVEGAQLFLVHAPPTAKSFAFVKSPKEIQDIAWFPIDQPPPADSSRLTRSAWKYLKL